MLLSVTAPNLRSDTSDGLNKRSLKNSTFVSKPKTTNKTEKLYKEKLKSIDLSLTVSKQNVIKHIIQARNIEKSKHQIVLIKEALNTHIQTRLDIENNANMNNPNNKSRQYLQAIQSGSKVALTDHDLYIITEGISHQAARTVVTLDVCKLIHKSVVDYDDSQLAAALDKYDGNCNRVDALLFTKIALATSHNNLGAQDAQKLFVKANVISDKINAIIAMERQRYSTLGPDSVPVDPVPSVKFADYWDMTPADVRWVVLKRCLRKRLLLIALGNIVSKHLAAVSGAKAVHLESHLHEASHIDKTHSLQGGDSLISSTKSMDNLSNKQLQHNQMVKSLHKSQHKQQVLHSLIAGEMAAIYTSDILPLDTLRQHKHALKYTQKLALQKVVDITSRVFLEHYSRRAFERWTLMVHSLKVESYCQAVVKTVSAYKLVQFAQMNVVKRCYKAMVKFKEFASYFARHEQLAAALDIQRSARGYIMRRYLSDQKKWAAAIVIQKYIRRFVGGRRVRRRRKQVAQRKQLKYMLMLIDRRWNFDRRKKVARVLFKHFHRVHMAKTIQRVYRGHRGRKRFKHFLLIFIRLKSALLIQCAQRRRVAVVRVKRLKFIRKKLNSIIRIQRVTRGMLTRMKLVMRIRQNKAAIKIQYAHLRHKAYAIYLVKYTEFKRLQLIALRLASAIKIQKIARARIARKRVAILLAAKRLLIKRKAAAMERIKPVLLGHFCRKKYKPIIKANTVVRVKNMTKIQQVLQAHLLGDKARKFVTEKRIRMILDRNQCLAATQIQRVGRGRQGRKAAAKWRIEYDRRQALLNRAPYYYRMRDEYYRTQNMFHRPYLIKIQAAMRRKLAMLRVRRIKQARSVLKIVTLCKRHLARKKAQVIVQRHRKYHGKRWVSVVTIQRVLRGFVTRNEVCKSLRIKFIVWFLKETRCRKMTRNALVNFRKTKNVEKTKHHASIQIQALVRGKQAQTSYKHTYKRLVRQRNARTKERKIKAVIRIQSLLRMRIGFLRVKRQRQLKQEKERERVELEELEASLEGLHEDFMHELLVIRAQNGVRAMLAKGEFAKRVAEHRVKKNNDIKNAKQTAAIRIQALIRGVLDRKRFKKMLPALRKAIKTRMYCVECEAKMASRRCRQCKDRYCTDCYDKLHLKGHRKAHNYEIIRADPKMASLINGPTTTGRPGSKNAKGARYSVLSAPTDDGSVSTSGTAKKVNPRDWEEFFDANAKAKYWFNKLTGEASWINPLKQGI